METPFSKLKSFFEDVLVKVDPELINRDVEAVVREKGCVVKSDIVGRTCEKRRVLELI